MLMEPSARGAYQDLSKEDEADSDAEVARQRRLRDLCRGLSTSPEPAPRSELAARGGHRASAVALAALLLATAGAVLATLGGAGGRPLAAPQPDAEVVGLNDASMDAMSGYKSPDDFLAAATKQAKASLERKQRPEGGPAEKHEPEEAAPQAANAAADAATAAAGDDAAAAPKVLGVATGNEDATRPAAADEASSVAKAAADKAALAGAAVAAPGAAAGALAIAAAAHEAEQGIKAAQREHDLALGAGAEPAAAEEEEVEAGAPVASSMEDEERDKEKAKARAQAALKKAQAAVKLADRAAADAAGGAAVAAKAADGAPSAPKIFGVSPDAQASVAQDSTTAEATTTSTTEERTTTTAATAAATSAARATAPSTTARPPTVTTVSPTPAAATAAPTGKGDLKPLELRHDGNLCDTEEELWGGLCYKKCGLLTRGEKPLRKSPWTCCNDLPCSVQEVAQASFMNSVATAKMCLHHCDGKFGSSIICNGYDVSGDGSCPHKPGACLTDEELHVGVCYKKCELLTDGKYPYRSAAASCCKYDSEFECLKIGAALTSAEYEVGGGKGDHDNSTLSWIHPPQQSLTEAVEDTTTTPQPPPAFDSVMDTGAEDVPLKPVEFLHDGNVCGDTEELFEGLCYAKCSLLTSGEAPIRTSAWTCCEKHPCRLMNQRKGPGVPTMCHGYGVSGDGSCPHKPGACLEDEELYLGVCYKQCKLLTDGKYPHRSAPASCCKVTGLGCIIPTRVKVSKDFDVGGGKGDGDPSTPAAAHVPLQSLTEETGSKDGAPGSQLQSEDTLRPTADSGDGAHADDGGDAAAGAAHGGGDDSQMSSTWRVVVVGTGLNVRRAKSMAATIINVKPEGAFVKGRKQGDWLELTDEPGYMLIKFKGVELLEEVTLPSLTADDLGGP